MTGRGQHRKSGRRRSAAVTAIFVCLLIIGIYFRIRAQSSDVRSAAPVATSPVAITTTPSTTAQPAPVILGVDSTSRSAETAKVSAPKHLTVASIGVSTDLQPLKLLKDGSLQPPTHWGEAGWYSGGAAPGDVGPAVIAGHIDSTRGPAVFYRLGELRAGARILITEQTGQVLRFVVDDVHAYPKDEFPTATVYGPTPTPELRLITCTGEFDPALHSYLSNLVVFAHLAAA